MAGWTCPDRELNEWDGNIKAKYFIGDASKLTGAPAAAEVDPTFQAASAAIIASINSNTANTDVVSDAYYAHVPNYDVTSGGLVALSSAYYIHIPMYNTTSAGLVSLSAAYFTHIPNYNTTSKAIVSLSGAYYAHIPNYNTTSGGLAALSGAHSVTANNLNVIVSAAYYAHAADSSDPHGVTLTQTRLVITSGACTGDVTLSAAAYIPNVIYNTTSAGLTASTWPIGTLLVVYS